MSSIILIFINVTYKHPNHKFCYPVSRYHIAQGRQECRQELSLKQHGYHPCSIPGKFISQGEGSGTAMPVHLTDTCHWHPFNPHSQLRIDDNYHCYESLMHHLNILQSYQSVSSVATRSVNNTMLVWDTGASIGLTFSDVIDYEPLDGVTMKNIARGC